MFLLWDGDEDRLEPFTGQRFQAERLALRRASSLPRGDPGAARLDQGPRQAAGHSLPQQPAPRHRPYYARQTDAEVGGGGRHPEEALPFPYSEAFLRHALTGEGLRDRTSPGLDGTRQYSIHAGVRQNYEPKKAANGRRAEGHLALKRSSAIPWRPRRAPGSLPGASSGLSMASVPPHTFGFTGAVAMTSTPSLYSRQEDCLYWKFKWEQPSHLSQMVFNWNRNGAKH